MNGYMTAYGTGPRVGCTLDEKYSLTQLTPVDYRYVKRWDDGPVLQSEPRKSDKSGKTLTGRQVSIFLLSLYLRAYSLTVSRIFDGLDLILPRAPQYRLYWLRSSLRFRLSTRNLIEAEGIRHIELY